jgi:hypothetical protein
MRAKQTYMFSDNIIVLAEPLYHCAASIDAHGALVLQ